MSNRKALSKLTRRFPPRPEIDAIMQGLSGEKDMSVAIVASAIVEAALEQLLAAKLKVKTDKTMDQLFGRDGLLSGFYSKTLIAKVFGVITTPMADALDATRAIRNAFAHSKIPLDFDHELIAKEVRAIGFVDPISAVSDGRHDLKFSNKDWFLLSTKIILILLSSFEQYNGPPDEALGVALAQPDTPDTVASKDAS